MKALTIWSPWASLIAIGAKPYEFRSHKRVPRDLIGQRIGIHAGKTVIPEAEIWELLTRLQAGDLDTGLLPDIAIPYLRGILAKPDLIPRSCIVATAMIGQPVGAFDIMHEFGMKVNDSDRDEHANYAWPMRDVQQVIPPVEMKGAQGFWNMPITV